MFFKMKETQGFVGSPVSQPGGAPQSRKLHPEPQRPSEDSCEGLHQLNLKDNEFPPSTVSSVPRAGNQERVLFFPRLSGRPAQAAAASAGTQR